MTPSDLPMSGDEVWVSVVATGLSCYLWGRWYWNTFPGWPADWKPAGRGMLWGAPFIAMLVIGGVLRTVASYDVVDDPRYLYMYFMLGMAWVGVTTRTFPAAGLLLRDDAVERRNPAVAPAVSGAIIGIAAAYAGGNIGDGPGWWVVVGCALVATGALLLVWQVVEIVCGVSDLITVERDVAAGWRLGGLLTATGLILGRAVAGDWVSLEATIHDAALTGWPILLSLSLAVAFEKAFRPTVEEPAPAVVTAGVFPAIVQVALAGMWIAHLGLPQ